MESSGGGDSVYTGIWIDGVCTNISIYIRFDDVTRDRENKQGKSGKIQLRWCVQYK
jgi:hypothetical protein